MKTNLHFFMVVLQFSCALHIFLDFICARIDRRQSVVSKRLGVVGVRQSRLQNVTQIFDGVQISK
jgi:hypothetical protein